MESTYQEPSASGSHSLALDPLPGWKRVLDVLCSLLALPALALCTLIMTIVTQLTSPGPVFFRQERVGYNGRRFLCYKLRTMRVSADTSTHQAHLAHLMRSNKPMVKMDAKLDSRLIPGAWLLRACGLDELPQIINVLRGDMSLVGPRPCLPYEYEQYLPWQRARFQAVPGLTGLWQVSGKNRTTFDEMIRLDIEYVHRKSPALDTKIILMTVPALIVQVIDTRRGRQSNITALPPSTKVSSEAPSQKASA